MAATATSFMMIVYVASVGVGSMCRDRSDVKADGKTPMGHKILTGKA